VSFLLQLSEDALNKLNSEDTQERFEGSAVAQQAGYGMGTFLLIGIIALAAGGLYAKYTRGSDAKTA
jgi:hypothetical protein